MNLSGFENILAENIFWQIIFAYLAGLLTSLTPCCYPIIPITISFFRNQKEKVFLLALIFCGSFSIAYTVLGYFAASSGQLLGQNFSSPLLNLLGAIIFLFFSLLALDLLQLSSLGRLQAWAGHLGGMGKTGAALMGLMSGLLAAPCVGPILALILGLIAKQAEPLTGTILMFSFSVGLSTLYLILGVMSGKNKFLPKSGHWQYLVKNILAFALIYFALNFINLSSAAINFNALYVAIPLTAILIWSYMKNNSWIAWITMLSLGLLLHLPAYSAPQFTEVTSQVIDGWHQNLASAQKAAKESNKLILLDLHAEWCSACKDYEEQTFPDPEVQKAFKKFVLAEIDVTTITPEIEEFTAKYKILGLPTLLFLDAELNEIPNSRIEGWFNAQEFLKKLQITPAAK